ncbi:hypothetical protein GCM10025794_31650 [Massilia kyonggiensis]
MGPIYILRDFRRRYTWQAKFATRCDEQKWLETSGAGFEGNGLEAGQSNECKFCQPAAVIRI